MQKLEIKHVNEKQLIKLQKDKKSVSNKYNENTDYIIHDMKGLDNDTWYELIDCNKPVYKLPFRLLSFITSFSRIKMGKLINKHDCFNDVIRIQTDSITFQNEFKNNIEGFIYDKKISGDINFKHVNDYDTYDEFS